MSQRSFSKTTKKSGKNFLITPKFYGVGLAIVALIASVGGFGYNNWERTHISANALAYHIVWEGYGVQVAACNTHFSTQMRVRNSSTTAVVNIRTNATPSYDVDPRTTSTRDISSAFNFVQYYVNNTPVGSTNRENGLTDCN